MPYLGGNLPWRVIRSSFDKHPVLAQGNPHRAAKKNYDLLAVHA